MYDYIITKPELNDETLSHFLGGAHKYLNKYMGKNGKWVYVYNKAKKGLNDAAYKAKNKLYDLSVRSERRKLGFRPEDVSLVRQHTVKNGRRYLVGLGYRGDDGRARSTGSSSGNKGYTLTLDSVLAGRRRAKISDHNKLVANKTSKKGIYRPTSRKKMVGEGAGSVKIRGTKGLGLNAKANLMNHRVKGLKTELAIKEREKNRKAALRVSKNTKAGIAAGRYRAAQKKSVKRFYNTNTGPFPKDWNDLRFKGYSNSMTNAGEKGIKVKSGIEAGRKRVAKKKKK